MTWTRHSRYELHYLNTAKLSEVRPWMGKFSEPNPSTSASAPGERVRPVIERGTVVEPQMRWAGVRDRVIAMKQAQQHAWGRPPLRYRIFEPVLTAEEVAEVEAQYGVTLPEDYRTFLLEVGAGGPGPALELTTLKRIDGRWGWVWDHDEENPWLLDPSGPFVETAQWADQQLATLRAVGHEPARRDDELDYFDDYVAVFGEEAWHLERGRGAIHVSDNGCGMTGWLVIVGPHRGEVCDRDCAVNPPFDPYLDVNGNHHTFGTWYLQWLEQHEAQYG